MKKILVAVLVVCLFFIGSGVVLMLAPGVEIFGIRYISADVRAFTDSKSLDLDEVKDIYICSDTVKVNITYTNKYNSSVSFCQNFQGFTKTKYDNASLNVYVDSEKNLHIETKEMQKWVYGNNESSSNFLNIELASIYAMNRSLNVYSNSGDITINGDATYKTFTVQTDKNLVITDSIKADDVEISLGNSVNIDNKISAINYKLKSTGGGVNVTNDVVGDLVAQTKGGDIRFVSCNNLTASTGGGSVRAYGEGFNTVRQSANIKTRGGDVYLGNVSTEKQNALCEVKSVSGDIYINAMKDGNITSDRGEILIETARAIIVNTKVGTANVKTIEEQIVVNGRNSDVFLGENGSVNHAKVYTTTGKIKVSNTSGEVDLTSKHRSITLNNLSSEKINIYAGRAFTGENLKGEVTVYANGNINMNFAAITKDVTVSTGTKSNNVNINAGETSYLDVDYDLWSTKGKVASVYTGEELLDEGIKIKTEAKEGKNLIKVKTSYAVIKLTLKI